MAARMQPCRGFTLIEVLVALAIMAVMAVMSWQAIDGMTRAQERARAHADGTLALQAAFAQWHADLDAMMVWPQQLAAAAAPPGNPSGNPSGSPSGGSSSSNAEPLAARSLAWDGRVLRITRSAPLPLPAPLSAAPGGPPATARPPAPSALRVVAWTRSATSGQWWRWQSHPVRTWNEWASAWQAAQGWSQTPERPVSTGQAVAIAALQDWQLYYFLDNAWFNPLSSSAQGEAQLARVPEAIRLNLTLAEGQALTGPVMLDWLSPTFTPTAGM